MLRRQALAALAGLFLIPGAAQARRPLRLGVLPIHSTRVLVQRYEPLRLYLERILKQRVQVETAPNFMEFHKRTLAQAFDLVVTPAHMGRIAELRAGWRPLVQLQPDHDSMIVTTASHPIASVLELRGETLAVIDRLAMTASAAIEHIRAAGLKPDRDFQVTEYRTHASVIHALLSGRARAAVSTSQGMHQIPDDLRSQVTVFRHITDIPAFVIMVRDRVGGVDVPRLTQALLDFPHQSEGIDLFGRIGYTHLHRADAAAMARADPFTGDLLQLLP